MDGLKKFSQGLGQDLTLIAKAVGDRETPSSSTISINKKPDFNNAPREELVEFIRQQNKQLKALNARYQETRQEAAELREYVESYRQDGGSTVAETLRAQVTALEAEVQEWRAQSSGDGSWEAKLQQRDEQIEFVRRQQQRLEAAVVEERRAKQACQAEVTELTRRLRSQATEESDSHRSLTLQCQLEAQQQALSEQTAEHEKKLSQQTEKHTSALKDLQRKHSESALQLRQQLLDTQQQLEDAKSQIREHETRHTTMQTRAARAVEDNQDVAKTLQHENEMLRDELQRRRDEVVELHNELSAKQDELFTALQFASDPSMDGTAPSPDDVQREMEATIKVLRDQWRGETKQLKEAHAEELATLRTQHCEDMELTLERHKDDQESLKESLTADLEDTRRDAEYHRQLAVHAQQELDASRTGARAIQSNGGGAGGGVAAPPVSNGATESLQAEVTSLKRKVQHYEEQMKGVSSSPLHSIVFTNSAGYLRNVVVKFLCERREDSKARMFPAIATVLNMSTEEMDQIYSVHRSWTRK